MIPFLIILYVGIAGIILLLAWPRKELNEKPTYWYLVNWPDTYRKLQDLTRRQIKRAMLVGIASVVSVYRVTLRTSSSSAKRAVRKMLFPPDHTSRHERPKSDFLNDIMEHKKEIESKGR